MSGLQALRDDDGPTRSPQTWGALIAASIVFHLLLGLAVTLQWPKARRDSEPQPIEVTLAEPPPPPAPPERPSETHDQALGSETVTGTANPAAAADRNAGRPQPAQPEPAAPNHDPVIASTAPAATPLARPNPPRPAPQKTQRSTRETPAHPDPDADTPRDSRLVSTVRDAYFARLRAIIEANLFVLKRVPLTGLASDPEFRITIDRDGHLLRIRMVAGSGSRQLDDALGRMIELAQPFPPLPPYLADQEPIELSYVVEAASLRDAR